MNPYLRIQQRRPSSFYYAHGVLQTKWPEAVQEAPKVSVRILQEWPFGVAKEAGLTAEANAAVAKVGLYLDEELVATLQMLKLLKIDSDLTFSYHFKKTTNQDGETILHGIPEATFINQYSLFVWPKWQESLIDWSYQYWSQTVQLVGDPDLVYNITEAVDTAWEQWQPESPQTLKTASSLGIVIAFRDADPVRMPRDSKVHLDCQFASGRETGEKVEVRFALWNLGGFTDEKALPVYVTAHSRRFKNEWIYSPTAYTDAREAIEAAAKECGNTAPPLNTLEWQLMNLQAKVKEVQEKLEEKK